MWDLRDKVPGESFDYNVLMDSLSTYLSPRAKVTQLLRLGEIIRVKKGLYVFGPRYRRSFVSLEIVANQIYGPSYVSLEYALSFYGLIPEFVAEVTSVTTKRHKIFETPVGRFSYTPIPEKLFATGFTLLPVGDHGTALIATKEKALTDLMHRHKLKLKTLAELESFLFDNLRLEQEGVRQFKIGVLNDILKAGGNPGVALLITWIRKVNEPSH